MTQRLCLDPSRRAGISCSFALLLLVACGGGGGGSDPPQAVPLPEPVPLELRGSWKTTLEVCPCGPATLTLGTSSYQVDGPAGPNDRVTGSAAAAAAASKSVTFADNAACPGSGTYDWTISDNKLRFTLKSGTVDACPRRTEVLSKQAWTT